MASKRSQAWTDQFEKEYRLRVGIELEEGGVEDEELDQYYQRGYAPEQAVTNEIQKYGLKDFGGTSPLGR